MMTSWPPAPLILADEISPVAAKDIGVGQFVIGSTKVRPKVDQAFPANQPMGVFLQFYNLKVDDKTHKNNATVDIQVFSGDRRSRTWCRLPNS